jgi:hypothetical protein
MDECSLFTSSRPTHVTNGDNQGVDTSQRFVVVVSEFASVVCVQEVSGKSTISSYEQFNMFLPAERVNFNCLPVWARERPIGPWVSHF